MSIKTSLEESAPIVPILYTKQTEVQRMLPTGPRFRNMKELDVHSEKILLSDLWLKVNPVSFCNASLVAPTIKHLTAMRETWVRSQSWEDSLETGTATHWRTPRTV